MKDFLVTRFTAFSKVTKITALPTYVSWRSARCGHDARILHLAQAEVADHDLAVLVRAEVQQVLRLRKQESRTFRRQTIFDFQIKRCSDGAKSDDEETLGDHSKQG